ncbi:MAG: SRPBCC family protein [Bacteroidaceae bacterium]|nr:SRPBCC family protein [Bacteroidaceae bacterium]
MARYESKVKTIPAPQAAVYAKLSDLNNLAVLKEKLNDPEALERIKASGKVTDDQLQKASEQLKSLEFTSDTLSVDVPPVGKIAIRIVERDPEKCVKFESEKSPIPIKFWIQVLPIDETNSKLRLTLDASVNAFVKMMIDKPLQEGIERVAEALTMIPYE